MSPERAYAILNNRLDGYDGDIALLEVLWDEILSLRKIINDLNIRGVPKQ